MPHDDAEREVPEVPDVTTASAQECTPSAAEIASSNNPATAASLLAAILASMGGLGEGNPPSTSDRPLVGPSASVAPRAAQNHTVSESVPPVVTGEAAEPAVPEPVAQPEPPLPPISIPVPGFHSLGQGTAPPPVEHANFAPVGSTRWYCVTRGIRVGVFGGWFVHFRFTMSLTYPNADMSVGQTRLRTYLVCLWRRISVIDRSKRPSMRTVQPTLRDS